MEKAINISQLLTLQKFSTEFSSFADDYVFARLTSDQRMAPTGGPYRVDGVSWLLCLGGEMKVDVNLNSCHMTPHTLLVASPNSILSLKEVVWDGLDSYILFISTEFMRSINIDPNVLRTNALSLPLSRPPMMKITSDDADLMRRYFDLIHHNTRDNADDVYVRSITRCLVSALCYQVFQLSRKLAALTDEHTRGHSRRTSYVREFMQLVHHHHHSERTVGFYAERLFISPKYLSLVVKETTGRTAAEWIDDFVILEAKNRLKFSGRNIQQVAYDLNFPNQSSFGKYFKHLTGMSPSEYQRS